MARTHPSAERRTAMGQGRTGCSQGCKSERRTEREKEESRAREGGTRYAGVDGERRAGADRPEKVAGARGVQDEDRRRFKG